MPVTATFKAVPSWFPSCSIAGIVQLFDCWTCLYLYILGSVRWPHLLLMNNPRCNNPFLWTLLVPLFAFEQGHVWACLLGGVELVTIMSFIIEINEDSLACLRLAQTIFFTLWAILPQKYLEICFLKIKFSRWPYPRPNESPVKVPSPWLAWFGSLFQMDRQTDNHTDNHTDRLNFII